MENNIIINNSNCKTNIVNNKITDLSTKNSTPIKKDKLKTNNKSSLLKYMLVNKSFDYNTINKEFVIIENNRVSYLDLLLELNFIFKQSFSTLCKSITIMDKFFSLNKCSYTKKSTLFNFALVFVMLSSKINELRPISINDIILILSNKKIKYNTIKLLEYEVFENLNYKIIEFSIYDDLKIINKYIKKHINFDCKSFKLYKSYNRHIIKLLYYELDIITTYDSIDINISIIYLSLKILKLENDVIMDVILKIIKKLNRDKKNILKLIKNIYDKTANGIKSEKNYKYYT